MCVAQVPLPPHLSHLPYEQLQFTLVDCPGHASLIRTIIGGVQIIDMMILVIDTTKGGWCSVPGGSTAQHSTAQHSTAQRLT